MKCVVNFASGQQCQPELRLYFGVCVLQKFQQNSHGDSRFACGGYSLRAGAFGLSIDFPRFSSPVLHERTAGYERRCSPAYPHWRVLWSPERPSHRRRKSSADRWHWSAADRGTRSAQTPGALPAIRSMFRSTSRLMSLTAVPRAKTASGVEKL